MSVKRIRILIAKPELDGHDRGAKVVALALRDAGMEVIYSGLHQSLERIVVTAIQESVNIIGLSIMTGAHLSICKRLIRKLESEELEEVQVVVGGVIPQQDIPKLEEIGVKGVFPGGTPFDEIAQSLRSLV